MGPETDFSLQNIPFGIISTEANQTPRVGVAIGDFVCDMGQFSAWDVFDDVYFPCLRHVRNQAVFQSTTLNAFAALGRKVHGEVRETLRNIFTLGHPLSVSFRVESVDTVMLPLTSVTMHLPMQIGDYTDFYAGVVHATHVGTMFRGQENALQANYKHIPVGYHGRASSIVVSGTPVRRPLGQIIVDPSKGPETGPSRKLDFELELGCFICQPNEMGTPIPIQEAEDHIFGYVLLNDWSARDIQAWEYVPLGPFNGKNFATTISPWVVLHDALAPSMTTGEPNDTKLQPYLQEGRKNNVFDISLTAQLRSEFLIPKRMNSTYTCRLTRYSSVRSENIRADNDKREALALVLSSDDRTPHLGRLSTTDGRPSRLRYNQQRRRERQGQRQSTGAEREREEYRRACRFGGSCVEDFSRRRRHRHARRLCAGGWKG